MSTPAPTSSPSPADAMDFREALEIWLGQYFPSLSAAGRAMHARSLMDYESSPLAPLLDRITAAEAAREAAEARADRLTAELAEARAALTVIAKGETTTFDEGLGFEVSVWLDEEEMSEIAARALTATGGNDVG